MFTITVETSFLACHQLTFGDGRQEDSHNHNWIVRTSVCAEKLDRNGIAVDFELLKKDIQAITAKFDGSKLEDLDCFKGVNASAEIVAKYIFEKVRPLIPTGARLDYIEVTEAPGCTAKYSD